jgi:excinuclease ABC subunit C
MTEEQIKINLSTLPDKPGVYQYYDQVGNLIYVGKAKSLKKRVSSYFQKDLYENRKTAILVRNIEEIRTIVVETELDALLLENNLIKEYQPKYNIQLKDDKTYPWLVVTNEAFPRIFPTRKMFKDGSSYFGPYSSVKMMNTLLEVVKQIYQLRTCKLNLSKENIQKNKFSVCLEYHIGNCKAPCVGKQSTEDYDNTISNIKEIIKGNTSKVIRFLKDQMQNHVEKMQFEEAQEIKNKLDILENYQSKSTVVSPTVSHCDVFSFYEKEELFYVNYIHVVNGAIIKSHSVEVKSKLDESNEDILSQVILRLRNTFESDSKEVIVPFEIELGLPNVFITIPQRGDKVKLLELSLRNAKYFALERNKHKELADPERHTKRILEQIKKDLRLTELPVHIECFDNSNFQGDQPVSACVVFKNAKPSKADYRHFIVKTVEGPNDFATMEEVVYRRYKRLIAENQELPQLIIVDGGKGQLSSAVLSLKKLGIFGKVAVVGIAKRLEEIFFPGDSIPLYIDKKSESLKVIQQLRNEAHRFGITHHRKRLSKKTIRTELTEIKGISDKTAEKLLIHFKSVNKIKTSTEKELEAVVGLAKAKLVFNFYNEKDNKD